MRRIRISSLLVGLVAVATNATATQRRQSTALLNYLAVGSVRLAFESDTFALNGRRVALTHSTFTDASRLLKPANVSVRGDAGDVLRWTCYRPAGSLRMSLILESDEMGGGNRLGGFEFLATGTKPELERKCVELDISPAAVETDRGLRLGLTRSEVATRLGVAGRDSADVVIFDRTTEKVFRLPDGASNPYTESAWFVVWFRANRVVAFTGWRVDAS